jgi:hypothetical protein
MASPRNGELSSTVVGMASAAPVPVVPPSRQSEVLVEQTTTVAASTHELRLLSATSRHKTTTWEEVDKLLGNRGYFALSLCFFGGNLGSNLSVHALSRPCCSAVPNNGCKEFAPELKGHEINNVLLLAFIFRRCSEKQKWEFLYTVLPIAVVAESALLHMDSVGDGSDSGSDKAKQDKSKQVGTSSSSSSSSSYLSIYLSINLSIYLSIYLSRLKVNTVSTMTATTKTVLMLMTMMTPATTKQSRTRARGR